MWKRITSRGALLSFLTILLSTTLVVRAQLPTIADQVSDEVEYFLGFYKGYQFNSVFSLGDPNIICPIIKKSRGEIDPAYCNGVGAAAAALPGPPHVMKITRHPSIWDSERFEKALSMWHESLHLVEYTDGDTKVGTEDFNERHTSYFELMAVLAKKLSRLEDRARDPSVSLGTLKSLWDDIDASFKRGDTLNATYPQGDNIPAFSRRIGAQVDLSRVESLYRSGRAGDRLRDMFKAATASGFILEAIVPQQLGPRQWEFTIQYRAEGIPAGESWVGQATARIAKPDGSALQTLNLPLPGSGTSRQARVVAVTVPSSEPDGLYKATFNLRLQTHGIPNSPALVKTFPIATPAPPPPPVTTGPTPSWSPTPIPMPSITAAPPPAAGPTLPPFSVKIQGPRRAVVGEKISYTVSPQGGVTPISYSWDIDGKTPSGDRVGGDFNSPGNHFVEVFARDSKGRTATDLIHVDVRKGDFSVGIEGPQSTPAGIRVKYQPTVSGGKPPYRYEWTTQGESSRESELLFDYDVPGRYPMLLKVTDSRGVSATARIEIDVHAHIAIDAVGPYTLKVGEPAIYTPKVITGPPSGYTYRWEIDGELVGTGNQLSIKFSTPGSHKLRLRAKHPSYPEYQAWENILVLERGESVPLQVGVSGPKRVKAGSPVAVNVSINRGVPPFRWRWSGGGGSQSGAGSGFNPSVAAARGKFVEFQIEVWDSGRYKSTPFRTSHRVEVLSDGSIPDVAERTGSPGSEPLRAMIVAPRKGSPGDPITLTASVEGGKPPYRYSWYLESGTVLDKSEIKGRLKGSVGDIKQVSLTVEDSQTPTQTANASHQIELVKGGLRITKLEVSPSRVEPGEKAQITVYFTGSDLEGTDPPVDVKIWVEREPGAGKGQTKNGSFPLSKGQAAGVFPISKEAKPGGLLVVSTVSRDGQSDKKTTTLEVGEPINVDEALESDFVGSYQLSDPARSRDKYYGVLYLYADGRGKAKEWLNGKPSSGPSRQRDGFCPISWRFEDGQFLLDWTLEGRYPTLGRFTGSLAGYTRDFTLRGKWAGGGPGTLRFRRQ